jgi:hypothetical protein
MASYGHVHCAAQLAVSRDPIPVIHIRFMGGLGNQMFQYAAARLAAERLGTRFLISQAVFSWRDVLSRRQTIPLFKAFPTLDAGLAARCPDLSERYLPRFTRRMEQWLFPREFRPSGKASKDTMQGTSNLRNSPAWSATFNRRST